MSNTCDIEHLLSAINRPDVVVLDARSPGEFTQGHIPGAISFPLLNDEQRHIVGITYKEQGKQAAVIKGFELVGPLFSQYATDAIALANGREIYVYCWRGGLRSNVMAWILSLSGLNVTLLTGGYKTYRQKCLELFSAPHHLVLVAGRTGSGKSEILEVLNSEGESIIDLEGLANHKGSSFGALGQLAQPTQEHFENLMGWHLFLQQGKKMWVEDESRFIGKVRIPDAFYERMIVSGMVEIERTLDDRCDRILLEYGHFPKEQLEERTTAITKRMGGDRVKESVDCLLSGDMKGWLIPLMDYYDRSYSHAREVRKKLLLGKVVVNGESVLEICEKLKAMEEILWVRQ